MTRGVVHPVARGVRFPEGRTPYIIVRELSQPEAPHFVGLARDAAGDIVVLKRLRDSHLDREDLALRLRLEADILRQSGGSHGIVRLAALDEHPFTLILEYVGGGSLADRLHDARSAGAFIPIPHALRVAGALLEAIEHAHANGVVHRDVKPANVLFAHDGTVRLIDFGVAARSDPARGGACYGLPADWIEERVGTLPYAAPESVLDPSGAATPAQDIYAVGVVLYEMVTGAPPWRLASDESPKAFARRVVRSVDEDVPVLSAIVPAALAPVLMAALAPDPASRPSSRAFAAALGGR